MPEGIPYSGSNVVAGAGLELNYIGKHCYAYSGKYGANVTRQTMLSFTSGKQYIVGILQLNACQDDDDADKGSPTIAEIFFNGIGISLIKAEAQSGSGTDMPSSQTQKLLIPPFTTVLVQMEADDNQADEHATITFVGRLYG